MSATDDQAPELHDHDPAVEVAGPEFSARTPGAERAAETGDDQREPEYSARTRGVDDAGRAPLELPRAGATAAPPRTAADGHADSLTLADAEHRYAVSARTLRRRIKAGEIPGAFLAPGPNGAEWRVPLAALDEYPTRLRPATPPASTAPGTTPPTAAAEHDALRADLSAARGELERWRREAEVTKAEAGAARALADAHAATVADLRANVADLRADVDELRAEVKTLRALPPGPAAPVLDDQADAGKVAARSPQGSDNLGPLDAARSRPRWWARVTGRP